MKRDEIDQQEEMNQGGETSGWDAVGLFSPLPRSALSSPLLVIFYSSFNIQIKYSSILSSECNPFLIFSTFYNFVFFYICVPKALFLVVEANRYIYIYFAYIIVYQNVYYEKLLVQRCCVNRCMKEWITL